MVDKSSNKNRINFIPELYCTKRVCNKDYSKTWLRNNGYPNKPIYQVLYQRANKARYIKVELIFSLMILLVILFR